MVRWLCNGSPQSRRIHRAKCQWALVGSEFAGRIGAGSGVTERVELTGTMGKCGASSVVHPVRVQWSMGDYVSKYDGPVHPQGREVTQLGSIQLVQPASWLWTIVDWGENYGSMAVWSRAV